MIVGLGRRCWRNCNECRGRGVNLAYLKRTLPLPIQRATLAALSSPKSGDSEVTVGG